VAAHPRAPEATARAIAQLPGSFWPSPQQRLLLRTALLPEEESRRAWLDVCRGLDIGRLERGSAMLLPMIYERLEARGAQDAALEKMKGVYRYVWTGNNLALAALRDLLGALDADGVETRLFGAASLASGYYRSLAVRRIVEPAVLVHGRDVQRALAAAGAASWSVAGDRSDRRRLVVRAHGTDTRTCAIHWRLSTELDPAPGGPDPLEGIWSRHETATVLDLETLALDATDELLLTCLDGARTGNASRVQWVADAYTIVARAPAPVDWARLTRTAITGRCALRIHDALAYLASEFDVAVPAETLAELADDETTGRERLAHRVAGHGGGAFGNVPAVLAAHLVRTQRTRLPVALLRFPGALRASWGLDHAWQVPVTALDRAREAARARREFRRHRR
jgi:hypothetical protein